MATMSPTPMGAGPAGPTRRTSQRQALRRPPSRLATGRSDSQPIVSNTRAAASSTAAAVPQSQSQSQQGQQQYHDESSEDEIPVPMKLSALTKALLNDGAPENPGADERADARPMQPSPPRTRRQASVLNTSTSSATERRRNLRSGSAQPEDIESSRVQSPDKDKDSAPPRKRVVRLSHTPQSLSLNQIEPSKRRSTSSSKTSQKSAQPSRPASRTGNRDKSIDEVPEPQPNGHTTPNQAGRVVRIAVGSSGNRSRIGSVAPSSGRSLSERSGAEKSGPEAEEYEDPEAVARDAPPVSMGSIVRYPSTSNRTRQEDYGNPQSSMRVKRVGKLPGSFLSGPARRGRRRQSEEDGDENGDPEGLAPGQEPSEYPVDDPAASSFYGDADRDFNSGSPVSGSAAARATHRRQASNSDIRGSIRRSPNYQPQNKPEPQKAETTPPKPAPFRPELPSTHDQENEVPASYKRSKPSVDLILEKIPSRPLNAEVNLRAASPERKPLSSIAQNTPHRAAPPPPPKMSVLDTATAPAGAATTTQKARRNVMKVNGKIYTRLDCLGRGGSAKVYRVTAENGRMFALKRVSLEHADESTIRGYRGEIDLLSKLSGVDRVIDIFDHEMNEEKQVLTLLMEMGELDLNSLLRNRQSSEAAKFDPVFIRFYWKEMLECLRAVHQHDVVHSDLKPANFVLVRGSLKLIDFGIANAIQTDQTVNVHRDTQIGTPNYMSPESLMDSNQSRGARIPGRPKLMKLGKPSDVWSLGCILYQMVYGVPPFGHIANQMARCQAIINWDHQIEFPSRGMGGVPVPPSLIRTMKRCLIRETHMRPTCEELLHETDPFLYPAELSEKTLPIDEEMLGRIIQSVVTRCRERMPTESESVSVWPQAYWASVKKAMAGRPT